MSEASAWALVVGMGAFHGLNPAMGWLFAVALGLQRGSRSTVFVSLLPIAAGHAGAVLATLLAVVWLGTVLHLPALQQVCGAALIAWAGYHAVYGHRGRVRVGMTAKLGGLAAWSFLMASAHGAGLMLIPALIPLGLGEGQHAMMASGQQATGWASSALWMSLAVTAVHLAAMLAVTAAIAAAVYEWVGVGVLRRAWLNIDRLWLIALAGAGIWLLVA